MHKINDVIIVRKLAEDSKKSPNRVQKESILKSLLLLHLLFNPTETLQKDSAFMLLLNEGVRFKNRGFPCLDDVINIMLAFMTNKVPCFSYFSNILLFGHRIGKVCYE